MSAIACDAAFVTVRTRVLCDMMDPERRQAGDRPTVPIPHMPMNAAHHVGGLGGGLCGARIASCGGLKKLRADETRESTEGVTLIISLRYYSTSAEWVRSDWLVCCRK